MTSTGGRTGTADWEGPGTCPETRSALQFIENFGGRARLGQPDGWGCYRITIHRQSWWRECVEALMETTKLYDPALAFRRG